MFYRTVSRTCPVSPPAGRDADLFSTARNVSSFGGTEVSVSSLAGCERTHACGLWCGGPLGRTRGDRVHQLLDPGCCSSASATFSPSAKGRVD